MNTAAHPVDAGSPATRTGAPRPTGRGTARATGAVPRNVRDADGMAVASFLLGLPGLLVLNVVLGPAAVVLALVAFARGTRRRGRAALGLALGVADLAIMVAVTVANHGVIWSFT
ncbi:hypothetical protein RVR_9103 [Actinacidiphila reveromycinica]|uniref:DUF4190 domain-containing protein n=2 Tax=Actinacidiphila reveromycinica TaxID=659352 RepID=A0A7U3VS65_9ACTN|nr:DUF4190 domain-containing protein [Streptomyces sp. SN-593]BBB01608.1 hypothetical protein RVR_9103 [Streptomyces sp. SN-593]